MNDEALPLLTRLWLAWVCWLKILVDSRFAARVAAARVPPPSPPDVPSLPPPEAAAQPPPEPTFSEAPVEAALQLLGVLQREGRLIDFLEQDVSTFDDAAIGAAARVVHDGCRRALRAHATIVPVRNESEGASVDIEEGFDLASVKFTGNVGDGGPRRGVLRHRGWRSESLKLPKTVGPHDPSILAPAEIEL
jgi:hypothetical protein